MQTVPETELRIQPLERVVVVIAGQVIGGGPGPTAAQAPVPQGAGAVAGGEALLGGYVGFGVHMGAGEP